MQVPPIRIDDLYLGIGLRTSSGEPHPRFVILPKKTAWNAAALSDDIFSRLTFDQRGPGDHLDMLTEHVYLQIQKQDYQKKCIK